MPGRATFNLYQRTAGKLRLLWNRCTPTRRGTETCNTIASFCSGADVNLTIQEGLLHVEIGAQKSQVYSSEAYVKCLSTVGFQELELPKGTSPEDVKYILDTMSDRTLVKVGTILKGKSIALEVNGSEEAATRFPVRWMKLYEEIVSTGPPVHWTNLYEEVVSLKKHLQYQTKNFLGDAFVSGFKFIFYGGIPTYFIASVIFKSIFYEPTPEENFLIFSLMCALNFLVGFGSDLIWDPAVKGWQHLIYFLRHSYREFRFENDFHLMVRLSNGEICEKKGLANVLERVANDALKTRLSLNWDFEILAWALESGYLTDEAVRNNPRIIQSIVSARFSTSPSELRILALNPIWYVREVVARNANTPEDVLGGLVNDDPHMDVRKAIVDNPQVQNLQTQASTSTSPTDLDLFRKKPFPCVRAIVAENLSTPPLILKELCENDTHWMVRLPATRNPNTPWDSIALFLSRIKPDTYLVSIPTGMYRADRECTTDRTGNSKDWEEIYELEQKTGYVTESLAFAREILDIHGTNRERIMIKLMELNPALHAALTSATG